MADRGSIKRRGRVGTKGRFIVPRAAEVRRVVIFNDGPSAAVMRAYDASGKVVAKGPMRQGDSLDATGIFSVWLRAKRRQTDYTATEYDVPLP